MTIRSSIKQDIVKELDHLPLKLQRQVLDFTKALVLSSREGVPGKELLRFAGILDADEAEAMAQAIESGCEKVDMNEW